MESSVLNFLKAEWKVSDTAEPLVIFDKFVDGAQPEVAGEIIGCWHILRTLYMCQLAIVLKSMKQICLS
jgi:hypothetical protein